MRNIGIGVGVLLAAVAAYFLFFRGASAPAPEHKPPPEVASRDTPAPVAVPLGSVTGRVTDDKGAPVPSAVVSLAGDATHTVKVTATGEFTWRDLPVGRVVVTASAPGFLPTVVEDVAVAPGAIAEVTLVLVPGGRVVAGTVTDRTGGPIAGAVVTAVPVHGVLATRGGQPVAALTDAQGRYEIGVGEGTQRLAASHPDYVPEAKVVETRGARAQVDFTLTPGGVIEGIVRARGTGAPVADARVGFSREAMTGLPMGGSMAIGARAGAITTDAEGRFRITGLEPGTIELRARAAAAASDEPVTVQLGVAETVSGVELEVIPARAVSGTVKYEDGSAAVGAEVAVRTRGPGGGARGTVGENGRFRVDGLLPGRYMMEASGADIIGAELGRRLEVGDKDITDLELVVKRGVEITGKVTPAVVAEVRLVTPEVDVRGPGMMIAGLGGGALTRTDGRFRLRPVSGGKVQLEARAADGRRGSVSVEVPPGGLKDVEIPLDAMASVSGRVRTPEGKPVPGAVVKLRPAAEADSSVVVNGRDVGAEHAPADEEGRFALAGLAPSDYEVSVLSQRGEPLELATTPPKLRLAADEARTGLDLVVEPPDGVLRGTVVDDKGAPVADAWVSAIPISERDLLPGGPPPPGGAKGPQTRSVMVVVADDGDDGEGFGGFGGGRIPPALTDDSGRFEIAGLRRGDYRLMAEGQKGTARGGVPKVATGSDVTIPIVGLTELAGKVTDSAGKPVTSFTVFLDGGTNEAAPSHQSQAFRSESGDFRFSRLEPGSWKVRATTDDGSGEATVTVISGKKAEVAVTLVRFADVTGQVLGLDGKPVAGAPVVAAAIGPGGRTMLAIEGEPDRTDKDGRFKIGVAPGKHMLIVLGTEPGAPLVRKPIEVKTGERLDLGKLQVGPPADEAAPRKASL